MRNSKSSDFVVLALDLLEKELSFLKSSTFWVGVAAATAILGVVTFFDKAHALWQEDGQFVEYIFALIRSILKGVVVIYSLLIMVLSGFIAWEVYPSYAAQKRPSLTRKPLKKDMVLGGLIGLALFSVLYIPCLIVNFLISLVS